jgi:acyl-coenzyme A thioesterase PaaI-like protein
MMNAYMQLHKSFLDYGMRERLSGFYFYSTFFQQAEMDSNKISNAYCIFSPKEQLCGHPNIQHGGATATIIDQNAGVLAMIYSYELVATSELNVRYLKPVKKGQTYAWHGEVTRRDGRKIYIKSSVVEL